LTVLVKGLTSEDWGNAAIKNLTFAVTLSIILSSKDSLLYLVISSCGDNVSSSSSLSKSSFWSEITLIPYSIFNILFK